MIGLDTGFFLELINGNEEAVSLWRSAVNDDVELVVSCLTLFEIERLGLKGMLRDWETVLEAIHGVTLVVWLDRDVLSHSNRLSYGTGIPSMDTLILASLLSRDVGEIYTTDSDLESNASKGLSVRNLRKRK
jgi:predicted nucleic acid-binding protein